MVDELEKVNRSIDKWHSICRQFPVSRIQNESPSKSENKFRNRTHFCIFFLGNFGPRSGNPIIFGIRDGLNCKPVLKIFQYFVGISFPRVSHTIAVRCVVLQILCGWCRKRFVYIASSNLVNIFKKYNSPNFESSKCLFALLLGYLLIGKHRLAISWQLLDYICFMWQLFGGCWTQSFWSLDLFHFWGYSQNSLNVNLNCWNCIQKRTTKLN